MENKDRKDDCPKYGKLFCKTPYECCKENENCEDIKEELKKVMKYYDTNGDKYINEEDVIASKHLEGMKDNCDLNGDGSLNECEMEICLIEAENL